MGIGSLNSTFSLIDILPYRKLVWHGLLNIAFWFRLLRQHRRFIRSSDGLLMVWDDGGIWATRDVAFAKSSLPHDRSDALTRSY